MAINGRFSFEAALFLWVIWHIVSIWDNLALNTKNSEIVFSQWEFSGWVSLHTWAVLIEISCWAWPWGLSILVGLWLGSSLHLGQSFCFLFVSPTKWTKLLYITVNFYSTWALVVSKNEMYSWALINIYDRF